MITDRIGLHSVLLPLLIIIVVVVVVVILLVCCTQANVIIAHLCEIVFFPCFQYTQLLRKEVNIQPVSNCMVELMNELKEPWLRFWPVPCFCLRTTCIKTLLVERCECDNNCFLRFLSEVWFIEILKHVYQNNFLWEKVSAQKFKEALRSPRVKALIHDSIADATLIEKSWDL